MNKFFISYHYYDGCLHGVGNIAYATDRSFPNAAEISEFVISECSYGSNADVVILNVIKLTDEEVQDFIDK